MDMLNVTEDVARKFLDGFKMTYPNVRVYQNYVQQELGAKGFVTNLYGRKYYMDDSSNYYKCNNYLIQGSAADMLKEVEIKICEFLKNKKSRFIMPIHDEVQIEIPPEEESIVPKKIKEIMEDVMDKIPHIPIVAEVEKTSTTWAAKKGVHLDEL
jgi:DNA polymerase-1